MDSSAFNELPLPRPPEKAHLSNPDGTMPNRVKWQYHYLATFFGGGSHYIVCDNPNDAPDLSCLGPFGYIAANGQALMCARTSRLTAAPPTHSCHATAPCEHTLPSPPLPQVPAAQAAHPGRRVACDVAQHGRRHPGLHLAAQGNALFDAAA